MKRIEVSDIREGDLIRQEWTYENSQPTYGLGAVEFRADSDGKGYWAERYADTFLLDRPVKLPTKSYAVVAPNDDNRNEYACVLEPFGNKPMWWYMNGDYVSENQVRQLLENGWRVVFEGVDE